jgi:NADH:ubiquinone oxidoreductase subunit E
MLQKLEGHFLQWQRSKSGKHQDLLIQTNTVVQSVRINKQLHALMAALITPNMSMSLQVKAKKHRLIAKFVVLIPQEKLSISPSMIPPPRNQAIEIKVCNSKHCCKKGSQDICRSLEQLQLEPGMDLKIKKVGCMGDCQKAPLIKIDGHKHQRLSPQAATMLVKKMWRKIILLPTMPNPHSHV